MEQFHEPYSLPSDGSELLHLTVLPQTVATQPDEAVQPVVDTVVVEVESDAGKPAASSTYPVHKRKISTQDVQKMKIDVMEMEKEKISLEIENLKLLNKKLKLEIDMMMTHQPT